MTASRSLSGRQFAPVGHTMPMFATAGELRGLRSGEHGHDPAGWARKLHESKSEWHFNDRRGRTLHQSIAAEGVQKPIEVEHNGPETHVWEGHHRIASAAELDPKQLVPVEHFAVSNERASLRWRNRVQPPEELV